MAHRPFLPPPPPSGGDVAPARFVRIAARPRGLYEVVAITRPPRLQLPNFALIFICCKIRRIRFGLTK